MRHTVLVIPDGGGELWHAAGPAISGVTLRWGGRSLLGSNRAEVTGNEIVWSGSFAEVGGGGVFDEDPRTWGAKGWDVLQGRVQTPGAGNGVVIRPHARHVVSDVPGCRRLLESAWAAERGVSLCYDPASMMTAAMMDRAEDHLRRMYQAIELFPAERLAMVVVGAVGGELGKQAAKLAMEWVPKTVGMAVPEREAAKIVDELRRVGG